MATYTRMNAWNNGGTFANTDLLWYARAVGAMQARAIGDPASWWFFAAIHGQYLQDPTVPINLYPGWGAIPAPPPVPISVNNPYQPPASTQFWDQCQHQTWFFVPWHRGYLLALETQIRADVVQLGGPKTWALPYWNYFGGADHNKIPPAFTEKKLPDGKTDNPLFVAARLGPDGTGKNIYVPVGTANRGITADCLCDTEYTGDVAEAGFGGPDTSSLGCFSHSGGSQNNGGLENNPHNLVHVFVGGSDPNLGVYGLMADPSTAALDPIFYVHHSNIDRMWAGWNQVLKNANPSAPNWLSGPSACGDAIFVMPMPGPTTWLYTPKDVNSLSQLNYEYESYADIEMQKCPSRKEQLSGRLAKLGAAAASEKVKMGSTVNTSRNVELVGASQEAVPVKGSRVEARVNLEPAVRNKVAASLKDASAAAPPDRVFLKLENIRGTRDASALSVYLNLPAGANPDDHPELLAGTVGLFGLRLASSANAKHSGEGLTFSLEITKIVDELHLNGKLDQDSLHVTIVPDKSIPDQSAITIGRISIYRKGQ
jgi:tyrosinase